MKTSDTITELAAAMAKAQGAIEGAVKGSVNPQFKSNYADLAAVIAATRQPLAENGLAVVQDLGQAEDGQLTVTTRLLHASGQWIETTASCPIGKPTAQAVGSAATYLRRYSLSALLGVPQVDDDGEAATAPSRVSQPRGETLTPEQAQRLGEAIQAAEVDLVKFLRYYKANSIAEIRQSQLNEALAQIEKRRVAK